MPHYELLMLLFFLIAVVYASAGFGGGSSYLAVLALFGLSAAAMRPIALLCNVAVVSGNVWVFHRSGHLPFRRALPTLLASVPMAFLGGYLPLRERTFLLLLGTSLVLAGGLLFLQKTTSRQTQQTENQASENGALAQRPLSTAAIGGGIGLLSGMVGIGGGIFLSPVLHLLRWASAKQIAATASLFILVNSLAGLAGQFAQKNASIDWPTALPLMAIVLLGGQIGSRLSAFRLPQNAVRLATAALTLYAGGTLIFNNL